MHFKSLTDPIISAMSEPDIDDLSFTSLAYLVFEHQFKDNLPYRAYCQSLSITPSEALPWQDIPAIPTDAFKLPNNPTCLTTDQQNTNFQTSGTTSETKGIHHFHDTTLYEESILRGWQHAGLPAILNLSLLSPSPDNSPHSSLVHMFKTLADDNQPDAPYLIKNDKISTSKIRSIIEQGAPVTILGTALAFLHLFEKIDTPLPPGSWAMETGGYKGTNHSLTKKQLYTRFEDKLGLPPKRIWNEYSMTEISSQFYTNDLDKPHKAPPWTRIRVVDPETNLQVEPGENGYLHIYDLANLHSCLAIRTQDIATFHDHSTFTLIGRDPSAIARGCSRSIDQTLTSP